MQNPSTSTPPSHYSMLDTALAYRQAGRSVVPIAPGTKWPTIVTPSGQAVEIAWTAYQTSLADEATILAWFPAGTLMGIGIVCGAVSGMTINGVSCGLEILDVDDAETLEAFKEVANFQGLSELVERLLYQRTPGGAGHYAYICQTWAGNAKLAQRQIGVDAKGKPIINTLVETRGKGGQAVVAPTPPGIHPEVPERGYELVRGSWEALPIITPDERQALLELARSFNEYTDSTPAMPRLPKALSVTGDRPGDWLNRTVTPDWWRYGLERHGWTLVHQRGAIQYWRRPGKDGNGWSATLGACGPYFYVFSSNAAPFEEGKAYTPFATLAFLEHGGDFSATAKALMVDQCAEKYPDAVALRPFLESQCSMPDVNAVFAAVPELAELERDTWRAVKRVLKAFLGNVLHLPDLEKTVKQARRLTDPGAGMTPTMQEDNRPVIAITTEMMHVVDQGQVALLALSEAPIIFQRARRLCVITTDVPALPWLRRPPDLPVIQEASPARLTELASVAARWKKFDARQDAWIPALPPSWFVETLQGRPGWPFPPLEGIVSAPTLRPDGSVLTTAGYDASMGLYLTFKGTAFPPMPDTPTRQDALNAVRALCEPFADFPFIAGHHLSASLAALCSVVARHAIPGNVPLFAVRSTTRGTGKGLLLDVVSMVALGRHTPRMAQTRGFRGGENEDEERKRLMAIALAGVPMLHIDNVVVPLGSGALTQALTSPTVGDRLLGKTEQIEAPQNTVFAASGNNMLFGPDMARRVLPIDLDPRTEKPEERADFRHSPLLPWVQNHRPHLLIAALTLLRAYCVAGRPSQALTSWGSFEAWSDLIRSALVWAGMADPCEGRKDLEADSDPEFERHATLLAAWQACYSDKEKTLAEVVGDIQRESSIAPMPPNQWNELHSVLGALDRHFDGKRLNSRALGDAFRKLQGRVIDGKRLVTVGKSHQAMQWTVQEVPMQQPGSQGSQGSQMYDPPCEMSEREEKKKREEKNGDIKGREEEERERDVLLERNYATDSPDSPDSPMVTYTDTPQSPPPADAERQHCQRCNADMPFVHGQCVGCSVLPDRQVFTAEASKEGGEEKREKENILETSYAAAVLSPGLFSSYGVTDVCPECSSPDGTPTATGRRCVVCGFVWEV